MSELGPATIIDEGPPAAMLDEYLGEYKVVRFIGSGGQASVFEVVDGTGHRRAAKVLRPELLEDSRSVARFRREAETGQALTHPNLLHVVGTSSLSDGRLVVVSELLDGRDLTSRLADGPLGWQDATVLTIGVARGLAAMHAKGLVHRDVKPGNIIESDGSAKLVDFGLARLTENWDATKLTKSGMVLGSPSFMSPEQIRSAHEAGPPADIYSLGATLFMLLTGQPPYRADNFVRVLRMHIGDPVPDPRDLVPGVPAAIASIVTRCLAKAPAERHSADELVAALERALIAPEQTEPPAPVAVVHEIVRAPRAIVSPPPPAVVDNSLPKLKLGALLAAIALLVVLRLLFR